MPLIINRTDFNGACLDMDGVVTSTQPLHERAWREAFVEALGQGVPRLTPEEYRCHIDGKRREEGITAFLAARGVPAGERAVSAIAERKNATYLTLLRSEGASPRPGVTAALDRFKHAGLAVGLFTASRNAALVLASAGLGDAFDAVVDGWVAQRESLAGKPAADVPLRCAELIRAEPQHCVLFEDAVAGIAAGVSGRFGLVVGVGEGTHAERLMQAGANATIQTFHETEVL